MRHAELKAPKGVIKVELGLSDREISSIKLTGDFFMYPRKCLRSSKKELEGEQVDEDKLLATVEDFYSSTGVKTPGLDPEHWVEAIILAVEG